MPRKTNEAPLTLTEILDRRPGLPRKLVEYVTRDHCKPHPGVRQPGKGRFRDARYMLSEFDEAMKRRAKRRPHDCLQFDEHGVTWVAEERLPAGVAPRTA